jgi:hypothetical protein
MQQNIIYQCKVEQPKTIQLNMFKENHLSKLLIPDHIRMLRRRKMSLAKHENSFIKSNTKYKRRSKRFSV